MFRQLRRNQLAFRQFASKTSKGKRGEVMSPRSSVSPFTPAPMARPWFPFEALSPSILGTRFTDELPWQDLFSQVSPSSALQLPELAMDISESNENYSIFVDLPGVKKEDLHLDIKGKILSLSADRKFSRTGGNATEIVNSPLVF